MVTVDEFKSILPSICTKETSLSPDGWTADNPLYGHCAVASALAQDVFGGTLLRGSLEGTPYAAMRSHYVNGLPSGVEDFTAPQFTNGYPGLKLEERTRAYVLGNERTKQRYKELAWRFARTIAPSPMFDDTIYHECFDAALESDCQKFHVGCVVKQEGKTVVTMANTKNPLLESMCTPTCIRLSITSRTESMLGACDHAEERAIDHLIDNSIDPATCEFYVAGFAPGGIPGKRAAPEFTCLRCANQIVRRRLKTLVVEYGGGWHPVAAEEALQQAVAYALQQKKAYT